MLFSSLRGYSPAWLRGDVIVVLLGVAAVLAGFGETLTRVYRSVDEAVAAARALGG